MQRHLRIGLQPTLPGAPLSSQKQEWLFFTPQGVAPQAGHAVILDEDEHHYATKVLRLPEGAPVLLTDGKGNMARAVLDKIEKRLSAVRVAEVMPRQVPTAKLVLALALPRPQTLWDLLPALPELGVDEVVVFPTERTAIRTRPSVEKAEKLLREGLRVSKSAWAPHFVSLADFESACAQVRGDLELFCDESGLDPASGAIVGRPHAAQELARTDAATRTFVLWIGPEASFSEAERAQLNSRPNARAVSLGPRILRVPTAVAVAAALVRAHMES